METVKKILTHDKAPVVVVGILTAFNFGTAIGMPYYIDGVLTILGIAFIVFRKQLS